MLSIQDIVNGLHDEGVIHRIINMVGFTGTLIGQPDFEIKLYGLRNFALPGINTDQGFYLKIMKKNNIHMIKTILKKDEGHPAERRMRMIDCDCFPIKYKKILIYFVEQH